MRVVRRVFLLACILLVGLTGCLPQLSGQPVPRTGPDAVNLTPEIRSVEVLQSDHPQQVLVIVEAVVQNTCTKLGDPAIERAGQIFTISLPGEQASTQGCLPGRLSQDRVIRLPVEDLSPGSYLVLVNGVLGSFKMDASGQPVASQVTAVAGIAAPTATPTLEPTQLPSPTVTPTPVEPLFASSLPTAAPLALAVGDDPSDCTNRAALYGALTVPDGTPFAPGTKFTKTWMVMNTGSCIWGSGYQLVFAGGDALGVTQKVPLPKTGPKQVVQVSVEMTAPVAPQEYESNWAFETPQGYVFGLNNPSTTPLSVKISVVPIVTGLPDGLDCGALRQTDMEAQVLEQINAIRTQYGLKPVELVEDISKVALKHSLEMACYNRETHRGRDGKLYESRLQNDHIAFATSNEIIYSGNGGPSGAIRWWMNSPVHRSIILSDEYTQVGIGFVYFDRNPYKLRITADFIHP